MSTWRPLSSRAPVPPARLGPDLDRLARRLGAPGAEPLVAVFERWEAVAGPLAERCRPLWLARGALVVAVEDPGAATEVRYREAELLDGLARLLGEPAAGRVEVRVQPRRRAR